MIVFNQNLIKISIVIPCYNQGKWISATLDSITKQTFRQWEAIVIDDGSIDNSKDIVEKWINVDSRISYYYINNSGVSFARNYGFRKAVGEYIVFLDGDDLLHADYLQRGVSYLQEHETCSLFYSKAKYFDSINEKWPIQYEGYRNLLINNSIYISAIIRKKDIERIGGFDENLKKGFEDWDFWIRYLYKNGDVYQDKQIMFFYRKVRERKSLIVSGEDNIISITSQIYKKNEEIYLEYLGTPLFGYTHNILCWRNRKLPSMTSYVMSAVQEILQKLRFITTTKFF